MRIVSYAAWATIFFCLAVACYQDIRTKCVYRFLWWIGSVAVVVLWQSSQGAKLHPVELALFVILQHRLFAKYYGRADCRAFSLCAAALAALGGGMFHYLMHMLAAFLLLAVVQLFRSNVASDGNLSHPVAFLPYITIAFLFVLWYYYT